MKRIQTLNLLLIMFMLAASGCAQHEAMKKDDGLVSSTSRKGVETKNETLAVSMPVTMTPPALNVTEVNTRQIVPVTTSAALPQKESAPQAVPAGVVYFGFDSYVLTPESGNILQANFKRLESRPPIQIEGHCDEQGSSEYNLALGEKRAKAARNYLVTLGYPDTRISTISYGKERPAAPGHDDAAWAKNRRDEIQLVR